MVNIDSELKACIMKTFRSAADFKNYLDTLRQNKDDIVGCQPIILPEDIKYTGRGAEEVFEKGYIICLYGRQNLNYCFECDTKGRELKEAGGKIKPPKKSKTMKEILAEKRLREASK